MEFKIAVIGSQLFGDISLIDSSAKESADEKGFVDHELKKMLKTGSGDRPLL